MTAVFLNYSQAELDDFYDQRLWARDAEASIARLGTSGATARGIAEHEADIPYGPSPDERLDWFGAQGRLDGEPAPIHLHIHGGAWRNLRKEDASFSAPAFAAAGVQHVVPNFSKLPGVPLTVVVDQLARAVAYVHRHAAAHGGDPSRILLSGHSSGAHLAAVLMTFDWAGRGLPADVIRAGLCVGGLYDLEPVLLSARGAYVKLSGEEVDALSPIRHAAAIRCPIVLVHGGRESPEFIRQTRAFAEALQAAGRRVALYDMPDADHFEVNEAFGIPGSTVHAAALAALAKMAQADHINAP